MQHRLIAALFTAAVLSLAGPAAAQDIALPPLWTGAAGTRLADGTVRDYPGTRAAGDVLIEAQFFYARTGRLTDDWSVSEGPNELRIPAGTPMFTERFGPAIRVATDPGVSPSPPTIEPAPGSVHWGAELPSGRIVFFFRTADGQTFYNAQTAGRVMRGMMNRGLPGPEPHIREEPVALEPFVFALLLREFDESGYTLRRSYSRAGQTESYAAGARQAWDQPFNAANFGRTARLSPVRDAAGTIVAARVEITPSR